MSILLSTISNAEQADSKFSCFVWPKFEPFASQLGSWQCSH